MSSFKHLYATLLAGICAATLDLAQAAPSYVTNFLNEEGHTITEDGMLPFEKMSESMDFVRAFIADWRQMLLEQPAIAPDARRQSLLIVAGEFLPPKEYVAFVDLLCGLRSQNKVTPNALRFVLWASMSKKGFLAFNFDHPEVSAVSTKLESLINSDFPNDWQDYFSELKSGRMKEHLIERINREGGLMPESFADSEGEPYQQLMGGSVKADIKLLAKSPIEAVTSLASTNRSRWSMIVALVVVIGPAIGLFVLLLKIKRRAKR